MQNPAHGGYVAIAAWRVHGCQLLEVSLGGFANCNTIAMWAVYGSMAEDFKVDCAHTDAMALQKRLDLIPKVKIGGKWYWRNLSEIIEDLLLVQEPIVTMPDHTP
jgi:hypothetical protein